MAADTVARSAGVDELTAVEQALDVARRQHLCEYREVIDEAIPVARTIARSVIADVKALGLDQRICVLRIVVRSVQLAVPIVLDRLLGAVPGDRDVVPLAVIRRPVVAVPPRTSIPNPPPRVPR